MKQQAVNLLERDLGQIFVRAMHGVTRLESHHCRPAAIGERRACFGRRRRNVASRLRCDANRAGDDGGSLREQCGDTGMRLVGGPVHLTCLSFEIAIEDLCYGERSEEMTALVAQGDDSALMQRTRLVARGKRDGQRPGCSIDERCTLDHTFVVAASLEPTERASRRRCRGAQDRLPRSRKHAATQDPQRVYRGQQARLASSADRPALPRAVRRGLPLSRPLGARLIPGSSR